MKPEATAVLGVGKVIAPPKAGPAASLQPLDDLTEFPPLLPAEKAHQGPVGACTLDEKRAADGNTVLRSFEGVRRAFQVHDAELVCARCAAGELVGVAG